MNLKGNDEMVFSSGKIVEENACIIRPLLVIYKNLVAYNYKYRKKY